MPRLIDQAVLDQARGFDRCEVCGRAMPRGVRAEPHHAVLSRGAGGPDIPENIIACDRECHRAIEAGVIPKHAILALIACRHGLTIDELQQRVWRLARESHKANIPSSPALQPPFASDTSLNTSA